MKTYPLLKKAPKDHDSKEFLQFLRENNKVVFEDDDWLIIENCKYHTKKQPWHTAFYKEAYSLPHMDFNGIPFKYDSWEWLKKAKKSQTVKRFHIHLIRR